MADHLILKMYTYTNKNDALITELCRLLHPSIRVLTEDVYVGCVDAAHPHIFNNAYVWIQTHITG